MGGDPASIVEVLGRQNFLGLAKLWHSFAICPKTKQFLQQTSSEQAQEEWPRPRQREQAKKGATNSGPEGFETF